MKKTLLLFAFIFMGSMAYAQQCGNGSCGMTGMMVSGTSYSHTAPKSEPAFDVQVFPNPSVNYIKLSDNNRVRTIRIYTLNGVLLSEYPVTDPDASYDVSGLADGNYLIRVFDWKDKPLKAKLIQKISTESQR